MNAPTVQTKTGNRTPPSHSSAQSIKIKRESRSVTSSPFIGYMHDLINSNHCLAYLVLLSQRRLLLLNCSNETQIHMKNICMHLLFTEQT